MFRDKNYGLDKDLINTTRNIMEGVEIINESKIVAKFSKYLDENFHVDQLTEEEIQWIYENEFMLEQRSVSEIQAALSKATNPNIKKSLRQRLDLARQRESSSAASKSTGGFSASPERPSARALDTAAKTAMQQRAVPVNLKRRVPSEVAQKGSPGGQGTMKVRAPSMPELDDGGEDSKTPISDIRRDIEKARAEVKKPSATPEKTPVAPARRKTRPARTTRPARQSWAQRQHSNYSIGRSSIFTPES